MPDRDPCAWTDALPVVTGWYWADPGNLGAPYVVYVNDLGVWEWGCTGTPGACVPCGVGNDGYRDLGPTALRQMRGGFRFKGPLSPGA